MTTILPTLELKYNKETSNSSNINTNNNNIIIKPTSENIEVPDIEFPEPISLSVKKSDILPNISEFKEALITVLISLLQKLMTYDC
jgi:hypothetical protein